MFLYPDQYFYRSQAPYRQEPPHPAAPPPGQPPAPHPAAHAMPPPPHAAHLHPDGHPPHPAHPAYAGVPPFFPPEFLFGHPAAAAAREPPSSATALEPTGLQGPPTGFPVNRGVPRDEHIAQDEEELEALRAFRAAKRRQAERERQNKEAALKRKAEAERRAKEIAQREHDLRVRAQVEANARAAAREYLRQKQARQNAISLAQKAERERQQQMLLEQLRRQFGLFTIPSQATAESSIDRPEDEENADDEAQQAPQQADGSAPEAPGSAESREPIADRSAAPDESAFIDPIRSLIEALSPYPIIFTTESSDEEEANETQQQRAKQENDSHADVPERVEAPEPGEPTAELDVDGPTCETVTEDGYDEEPNPEVVDISEYVEPRDKRQRKHHKRHHKKARPTAETSTPGDEELGGLVSALRHDFERVRDSYHILENEPATDNLQEIITRIEGVKICFSRSEEIYSKLDEIRVPKTQRKAKQQITSEAVALADKCEELLQSLEEQKQALRARTGSATSANTADSADSKPHHVTLEEVDDEEE